jgi:hypothetical protein
VEDSHLDSSPPIFLISPIMSIEKEYEEFKKFLSFYGRLLNSCNSSYSLYSSLTRTLKKWFQP